MTLTIILATAAFGVTAYVGVSLFFLKNPHYLHKKKKIPFSACHISHRGGKYSYKRFFTVGTLFNFV